MKKTLKILGLVVGGLLALFIIAAVALTLLFDPNDYKDDIVKLVRDKTGRELRIEGKLGWSFFPWIGFETGKLELGNAPGFGPEPFARLDGAGAKVKLLPLLRQQIVVDTVFLDGLRLNLAKNAAGKTNWDDLLAPAGKEKPAEKPAAKPEAGKEFDIRGISVNKIDIRKADVTWKDQASNAQYAVRNLDLQTGKIVVGEPVDVHLAFDVESGTPPVSKHLDLKSRIKLDLEKQSLDITNLALGVDDSRLTGTLALKNFDKPAYRFDLALDQIDLDRYLPAPATADSAKPAAATPAEPVEIPLSLLRSLDLQGKLGIGKLKAMNLHSTDVTVQVGAKNGLITLGPNQAKLYGGSYAGRTALDVRGQTPLLTIDESVSAIDLAPALKDALQFDKFTGTANLGAKVTAQGLDAGRIMETLNGTASFSVQKGAVKGMDLRKMIDTIKTAQRDNLLQKLTELKPQPADETHFTQLSGTARITNGVVQNDDLKVQSPDLVNVSGNGTADLPRQLLDYRVTVGEYPIVISGPFSSPKFRVDTSALLKGKVEEKKTEVKEKLEQKLEQKLKDKFKLR
ncbi:MAG TPA: AsmA family protein [Sulfuricaulis sp.]|nr:AsmA family protein [Sulfuricaulis sp.]